MMFTSIFSSRMVRLVLTMLLYINELFFHFLYTRRNQYFICDGYVNQDKVVSQLFEKRTKQFCNCWINSNKRGTWPDSFNSPHIQIYRKSWRSSAPLYEDIRQKHWYIKSGQWAH